MQTPPNRGQLVAPGAGRKQLSHLWFPAGLPLAAPLHRQGSSIRLSADSLRLPLTAETSMRPQGQGCGQAEACPSQSAGSYEVLSVYPHLALTR